MKLPAFLLIALFVGRAPAQTPAMLASGARVFAATCAVGYCHGNDGVANRGPRLRGRSFEAGYVDRVVRNGIPNSAMPAFAGRLPDGELNAVIAWVGSISTTTEKAAPAVESKTATERPVPAQFVKGRDLFFDAVRGTRCSTCHEADGRGTRVGPDISGKAVSRAFEPKLVRQAVLQSGETFPALPAGDDKAAIRLFDLTVTPPVLRTLAPGQIRSMEAQSKWRHNDVIASYSDAELADVNRYLNWLGSGK